MLGEFFQWWSARLAEIVPASWRFDAMADGDAVLVDWNGIDDPAQPGALTISLRRGGRVRPLPTHAGGSVPRGFARAKVILNLPASCLLERVVELPIAAARDP